MASVVVNGVTQRTTYPNETWGDLLDDCDRQCEARGEVITAARLDGVDQPTLRDPSLADRPLSKHRLIEVETTRPRDLVHSALDEAVAATDTLGRTAVRLGAAFRESNVSPARKDLVEFAQSLGSLVLVTNAVANASAIDLATVGDEGTTAVDMIDMLAAHMDALIGAQQNGDWIAVADVIEYDIATSLRRWPAVLSALRGAFPEPSACAGAGANSRMS